MSTTESLITSVVCGLVRRRHRDHREVGREADLFDELELDSLDVAELSALLEEDLGTDPFTEGAAPRNIREIVAFYDAPLS